MTGNGSLEKLQERIQTYEQAIALFEQTRGAMLARRCNATDSVMVHLDSSLAINARALKSLYGVLATAKAELQRALSANPTAARPASPTGSDAAG